jgi:hypothetical protein
MKKSNMRALALLSGGAVLAIAPMASAATVDCTALTHPVYIAGASEAKAYLQQLAGALGSSISLIYASPSACVGLADVATAGQTEPGAGFSYITTTGTLETCTAGATPYPPINVDIGVSGVFPSTCITPQIPDPLPTTLKDFHTGTVVQPEEIVVPWTATQPSISAEAAYVVFGFGAQTYSVGPWTETTDIWTRGVTAGAQLIVAEAIGLSGSKWLSGLGSEAGAAQIASSATVMSTDITTSSDANATIGILGSGTVDPLKNATGGIKPLAFQAKGQDCGYYPDSQLSTFDKINVRQGRYDIWGPEHFLTNVDSSGNPIANPATASNPVPSVNADVKKVIGIMTHNPSVVTLTSTPSLQTVITAEAAAYFVPDCAMQVERTSEIGAEASYQPPIGCGCFYENQPHGGAGSLSSYCVTCTAATVKSDCKDPNFPVCNFGYCEAQ